MEKEDVKVVKNNKGKTITIIVLILIILGLCGYIAYDKYFSKVTIDKKESKEEVKKEDDKNKEEIIELSDSEKKEINEKLEKYLTGGFCYNLLIDSGVIGRFKLVYTMLPEDKKINDKTDTELKYVKKNDLKDKYEEVFGKEYSFENDWKVYEKDNLETSDSSSIKDNQYYKFLESCGISPISDRKVEVSEKVKSKDLFIIKGIYSHNELELDKEGNEIGSKLHRFPFELTYSDKDGKKVIEKIENFEEE